MSGTKLAGSGEKGLDLISERAAFDTPDLSPGHSSARSDQQGLPLAAASRIAAGPKRSADPMVLFAMKLTRAQRHKLKVLGNGAWVRERIDRARAEPSPVVDSAADLRRYRLGRRPRSLNEENAASWSIIEAILLARGHSQFKVLAVAVTGHSPRDNTKPKPQHFVDYCIKRGWLVEVTSQG